MKNKNIAIYIPSYMGADYLKSVVIPKNIDVIVMDNASADNTEQICLERGFQFVMNNTMVPRTENWVRCIKHFADSNYSWMKWLFVGDELDENCEDIISKAINKYPDASIITFQYIMELPNESFLWKMPGYHGYNGKITSEEVIKKVISGGNIFGAPIASCISKYAVKELGTIEVSELRGFQWIADFLLSFKLSQISDTVYCSETIGKFNASKRNFYSQYATNYRAAIEEMQLRIYALDLAKKKNIYTEKLEKMVHDFCLAQMRSCYFLNVDLLDLQKKYYGEMTPDNVK